MYILYIHILYIYIHKYIYSLIKVSILIISNREIYITKKRNQICRYSEFHVTHATISSLLIVIITLRRNGTI